MTKNSPFQKSSSLLALLTLAAPAVAQSPAAPRTPPAVLGAARTIQFTATEILGGVPRKVSVASLVQPNKAFIQDTDPKTKVVSTVYACDGKTQTEYSRRRSRYTKSGPAARLADLESGTLALSALTDFLTPAAFAKFHRAAGDPDGVYRMPLGDESGKSVEEVMALDQATGLPTSLSIFLKPSEHPDVPVERILLTGWKLNAPISAAMFAYTPPATATLYTPPKLLADRTLAPDFTANDKDGHPVKLSDYRGKTVVLDFWATWCGPCQISLPHTTKVAEQYADKGVTVLAVNVWDTPKAFQAWLPKHPEYSALNFVIDPSPTQESSIATSLYGVSGIPTQYVIGKDGRVVKSIVGYEAGNTALEDALKAAKVR